MWGWCNALVQPNKVVLVDVGGGRGHDTFTFVREICSNIPEIGRVVLEDLPAVLADAEELEEGIEKIGYDFFTPQVVVGARVYYFAHVFHDWSDEAWVRILRNTKFAIELGHSKTSIYEFILSDTGSSLL